MNLIIINLKTKSKKIREFNKSEWKLVHPEHFGKEQNDKYWTKKIFFFKAEDKSQVVGTLDGDNIAGVMNISQLIVAHDKRGLGIGKKLMQEAEKLAKANGLHKIYLHTGTGWKAVEFYEMLGFIKETKLKNHYEHKDFWIMSKILK